MSKGNNSRSSTLRIIVLYEIRDSLRSYRLIIYTAALAVFSSAILFFAGQSPRSSASLLNLLLLIIPLFGMLFGALSFRDSLPFIQILLSRGISRRTVFAGKWLGMAAVLGMSVVIGLGISLIFAGKGVLSVLFLLVLSFFLQMVFVSLSLLMGIAVRKREVIPAAALLTWFYFYVLYDLLVLSAGMFSNEFPLEIPIFVMLVLNPLDLVRLVYLTQTNLLQLMGFSTAVVSRTLGELFGAVFALILLAVWIVVPLVFGLRMFKKRDM